MIFSIDTMVCRTLEKSVKESMLMWKDCMGLSTGVRGKLLFSESPMPA